MDNGEIESADEEMPSRGGRQYRPVVSHEQSIVQMTSMESGPPTEIPKQWVPYLKFFKNIFYIIWVSCFM